MTRKYIESIAKRLRACRPDAAYDPMHNAGWETACNAVADAIAAHNKAFDRARFLTDCGVTP